MALLCSAGAQTADRGSWDELQQGHLLAASDGDLEAAARVYEKLVRERSMDDPVRAEALYSLGRVRYQLGDILHAREALVEGNRTAEWRPQCRDLLGQLDLEQKSIQSVPVHWTFDSPEHGFFHPWTYDDKGSIRIQSADQVDDPALVWETVIDTRKGDQLIVGFRHPSPPPRMVSFRMQAALIDAYVRVSVVDELGYAYTVAGGPLPVRTRQPVDIVVRFDELVPVEPDAPGLQPAQLTRLILSDVSALENTPLGANALYIDEFIVR